MLITLMVCGPLLFGMVLKKNYFYQGIVSLRKPLYYFQDYGGVYFGSEVKFIQNLLSKKLSINYNYLNRYLIYGYKYLYKSNETFFL